MNKYKAKKINGKTKQVHRIVMEKYLKRGLTKEEVVHHIDGDKSNNDINNLRLFPNKKEHAKFHHEQGDLNSIADLNTVELIDGKLKCNKCGKLKDLSEFHKDKSKHFGRIGKCKTCYNKSRRKST